MVRGPAGCTVSLRSVPLDWKGSGRGRGGGGVETAVSQWEKGEKGGCRRGFGGTREKERGVREKAGGKALETLETLEGQRIPWRHQETGGKAG